MNKLPKKICALAYYRKDQYDRYREISVDKETFSKSYDETMVTAKSKHKEMENKGFKVVKIDIDIEELIEWCQHRGITINPESRTTFAMEKLKGMISNGLINI
jgi:hypothetical protein